MLINFSYWPSSSDWESTICLTRELEMNESLDNLSLVEFVSYALAEETLWASIADSAVWTSIADSAVWTSIAGSRDSG